MIAKKISRFIRYYFAKAEKILLNRPAITGSSVIHQKAKVCSGSQINDNVLGRYSYIGHDCFTCQVQIGAHSAPLRTTAGSAGTSTRWNGFPHHRYLKQGKNAFKTHLPSHPKGCRFR